MKRSLWNVYEEWTITHYILLSIHVSSFESYANLWPYFPEE